MRDRRRQVQVLHQQALRGQRLLESETGALAGELTRLQEAREADLRREALEGTDMVGTAGLLGNATRYRELVAARRATLAEALAAAEQQLEAHRVRLRQARQATLGWERLAERLMAPERQRLTRQEQETLDQHGQWRSRHSG